MFDSLAFTARSHGLRFAPSRAISPQYITPMQFTFTYIAFGQDSKFFVHRADCSDLRRKVKGEQNRWTIEAPTAKDAVKTEIGRLLEQDIQGNHAENFKICTCAKNRKVAN